MRACSALRLGRLGVAEGIVSCYKPKGSVRRAGVLTLVVLPCSPSEDFQKGQVALELFWGVWGAEGLDRRRFEQLGEDVGVRI